ncbi:MAG: flagellar hook-associated protein 3 [Lachnospiraceae bacterium]|nr:flagellar hook-associated protein 3 [Lachnospiraceae bacterium]
MRVTNNMIMSNTSTNINGTKGLVDKTNTQMTTQQKISRPSEDPVTAIRSLRLQTTLSKVDQYYEKNIPDATQWLDVTETALTNIKDVVTSMRTLCVNGSTGTLTQEDRNTILAQLKSYQEEIFSEGNADYAGRTVFTGFRTDKNLTYLTEDLESKYRISQNLSATTMEEYRYYTNTVDVPSNITEVMALDDGISGVESSDMTIEKSDYFRMRLGYDSIAEINSISLYTKDVSGNIIWEDNSTTPATGSPVKIDLREFNADGTVNTENTTMGTLSNGSNYKTMALNQTFYTTYIDNPSEATTSDVGNVYIFENEDDWAVWSKTQTDSNGDPVNKKYVGDNDMVIIKTTGDVIFGDTLQGTMQSDRSLINIDYDKYGFGKGELRPEYYFDCVDISDDSVGGYKNWIYYDKTDEKGDFTTYDINYTVAMNQTLVVNIEACEIFDAGPLQDMYDLQEAVNNSIKAHEKVGKIEAMMKLDTYSDAQYQEKLSAWLDIANKEMDYYDDNLSKMFSSTLGKVDGYLSDINLSLTKIGCTTDQLNLTEKRMDDQQESVQNLLSQNDDLDLSEIILKYTAAYNAYQSSLTAAGKLTGQTLLNFI